MVGKNFDFDPFIVFSEFFKFILLRFNEILFSLANLIASLSFAGKYSIGNRGLLNVFISDGSSLKIL